MPFRTAHEVTGRIVRDLYTAGKDFRALSLAEWRNTASCSTPASSKAVTPEAAVAARRRRSPPIRTPSPPRSPTCRQWPRRHAAARAIDARMFIGHFAVGFAAKRAAPAVSLGTLILSCQLADIVWPTLVLLGVERVAIAPGHHGR